MARNEVDTLDTADENRHITSPELRDGAGTETGEIINTEEATSLDEVHADAAYNRAVMGPEANDPTISTPGTEIPVEPGPGPEDNEALDNATGGAMSAAAESGATPLAPPDKDTFKTAELAARNLGKAPSDEESAEGSEDEDEEDEGFDPGEHTVADVEQFIAENPELRDDVIAAERAGKNRSSITG